MKKYKIFLALVLCVAIMLGFNIRCYAAAESIQAHEFTHTHTVNISGYGQIDVTVKWTYTDGTSAAFVDFLGSNYKGTHYYVDCHGSYHNTSFSGDVCRYSFAVVLDDDQYLITLSCDIYGDVGQTYSYLSAVGRVVDAK
ncbi:MAG: hypothetical protein J1F42_07120 [Lachnospiraceae bacterium]|nr:hypothetical protein [Lachnospiraceae bacterium]